MADYRYKAYISYSHRNEAWARWIQHSLESYRVPRRLVASIGADRGVIPSRIKPVFRDRADLSSASDLNSTVRQALAESENLIVLCSPDAADSRWVGEEIREFARLGRQQRIFCVIVDGDPASPDRACFPGALEEAGLQEPLAADARTWADGKRVAKLKLVAGILGIRLDKLLQRDLQRRRKQNMVIALGVVAALVMVVMTVVSQISRQHERDKAEQMAGFIVDLGETLQFDTDLETLAAISAEAAKHFQSLDADELNAETGKKVALVMRQTARISQLQGRTAEALDGFIESRNFFARLRQRHPQNTDLLFELGNAEFYVGDVYLGRGKYEMAEQAFLTYHRLTKTLLESDPENPDWIMERSFSHMNLATLNLNKGSGISEATLAHTAAAIKLAERVMELKPGNEQVISDYANALAWAADAQSLVCNLESALSLRERARDIAQTSAQSAPGSSERQARYAFAISGVAKLQALLGKLDLARNNYELVISMLKRLSAADPSNVLFHQDVLYSQASLARLAGEAHSLDAAKSAFQALESEFTSGSESAGQDEVFHSKYIDFLLGYADVESRLGNTESAGRYLQRVRKLLIDSSLEQSKDGFSQQRIMQLKYQWQELFGSADFNLLPAIPEVQQASGDGFRSCTQVDLMARMYVIEGDMSGAAREVAYLSSRGYADPAFTRFCRKQGLCE